MSTCSRCQGLIAEPGKAYSYSGKFCHCGWAHEPITHIAPKFGTPYDSTSVEEFMKRQAKSVQKPSMSHIINLCEQLSQEELHALVKLLSAMHDSAVLASSPKGFVPNAPSPYEVKGL